MADVISHYRWSPESVELLARWLERLPTAGRRRRLWIQDFAVRLWISSPVLPTFLARCLPPCRFRRLFRQLGTLDRDFRLAVRCFALPASERLRPRTRSPLLKR